MNHILLISDSYAPSRDATSIYNTQIVEYLTRNNIVSVFSSACNFKKEGFHHNPKKNLYIIKIPLPFQKSKNFYLKIINSCLYSFALIIYLILRRKKISIYLLHTSPPLTIPFVTFFLSLKYKISKQNVKKILVAHDIFPDAIYEITKNKFHPKSIIMNILESIYKSSYAKCDFIIACSESVKDKLTLKYAYNPKNINLIYNWSLISDFFLSKNLNKGANKNTSNKANLLLIGNFGNHNHICDTLLNKLEIILNSFERIKVNLLIRGPKSIDIIKKLSVFKEVYVYDLVPPNKLLYFYKDKHITVISLSRNVSQCSFPSRIATACSLKSPILFITDINKDNYLANFILENKIGYVIEEKFDEILTIDVFNRLINDYEQLSFNSYETYKKFFKMEKGLKNTIDFICNKI